MSKTTVHLINHTHWDREWFLTSIYTTEWIPGLIDRLEELVEANPDFHYLLDGQTLIIEDLLDIRPDYAEKIKNLVSKGNLLIGPYFCQPDWQLTGGETLMRNLAYGLEINAAFGGEPGIGWMVDTFGHLSQSPQIHNYFGIDTVFVWRGVPQLEPYFTWQGTGGHEVFAINLFGGYRNLYGVTHAPSIGELRLEKEADRLVPYYPTSDVPLFDGYDLEDNPEDPVGWFQARGKIPAHVHVVEATPASFGKSIRPKLNGIPTIRGELNSGKFGATFPGTFSNRPYLKLLCNDCEHLLYQVVEPLAAMVYARTGLWDGDQYKEWTKALLANAVHDAICGVSIDQVHEKMEYSYRKIFGEMVSKVEDLIPSLVNGAAPGRYLVSTSALPTEKWVFSESTSEWVYADLDGMGIYPAGERRPAQKVLRDVEAFEWRNDHYHATLESNGQLVVDQARFGAIQVSEERGDTYSDETGAVMGHLKPNGPLQVAWEADGLARVSYDARWEENETWVSARVSYTFDPSPCVGVAVELDSRGTNFHAEMMLETGIDGEIWAGMPFDRVQREAAQSDFMPRQIDGEMGNILMGQREINQMRTFPMHDFVGSSDQNKSVYLLARGNRSYRSWENGSFAISLRRSVEWVTEGNLENRVGDAGPFFYVPDARCERQIRHEMGIYVGDLHPQSSGFTRLVNNFQHTPLLVEVKGDGSAPEATGPKTFLKTEEPVAAFWPQGDQVMGRIWHTSGAQMGQLEDRALAPAGGVKDQSANDGTCPDCRVLNRPAIRIGDNCGLPDVAILKELNQKIEVLKEEVAQARQAEALADGHDKLRKEHQVYKYERELYEFLLSVRLNELKLDAGGALDFDYLYKPHPDIVDIGFKLNQLRIKRRIFDYVVTAI